ncbi:MAG: hypothetical protein WKF73_17020 [Nocardioidaceae bacterium]
MTGTFLTIPSLALFGLFIAIPGLGLGGRSVIVGLVHVRIASHRAQHDRRACVRLTRPSWSLPRVWVLGAPNGCWRVELPLAWPVILTGIRVSTLVLIGIAAIGAYINGPGLGRGRSSPDSLTSVARARSMRCWVERSAS